VKPSRRSGPRFVRLYSEYYGRGPTRAKRYVLDEGFVVTVVRDSLTAVERTLTEAGHGGQSA